MSNYYKKKLSLSGVDANQLTTDEMKAIVQRLLDDQIHGISFSPYVEGQGPGTIMDAGQIKQRLQPIQSSVKWIRSFSCTEGNQLIPSIAKQAGLKTMVGVWLEDDLENNEIMVTMNLWGTPAYMKDTPAERKWKITDRSREFDGYKGIRAIWQMNDSTRIYAWFCPDIVPVSGPEGFRDLPGLILGIASEDGSVVYFAKEVEVMEVPDEKVAYPETKDDIYNKEDLKALLLEKMGQWIKPDDLDAMFAWYYTQN